MPQIFCVAVNTMIKYRDNPEALKVARAQHFVTEIRGENSATGDFTTVSTWAINAATSMPQ